MPLENGAEGRMHAHGSPNITPVRLAVLLVLSTILTVLVVATAVSVVFAPLPANTPELQEEARPTPTASPSPAPVTRPTATPAPGTPTPEDCDDIYSADMVDALRPLVLNPDWTTEPGAEVRGGSDDRPLRTIINSNQHLDCRWVAAAGPSDTGVVTSLVWVSEEQADDVADRLADLGLDCYEELDGLRCITETRSEEGVSGQSHFLREGIWLATQFSNAGPTGYTHDMIDTIWDGD